MPAIVPMHAQHDPSITSDHRSPQPYGSEPPGVTKRPTMFAAKAAFLKKGS